MTLKELQVELERIARWSINGCTNHGCVISPPKGMGTNATCQCTPHAFSERLLWLAAEIEPTNKYARFEKEVQP